MQKINNQINISELKSNFDKVVQVVASQGSVIITEEGKPKYKIINVDDNNLDLTLTENERLEIIAKRILQEHKHAFEVLGQ